MVTRASKNTARTDIVQPGEIIPISWDFADELAAAESVISTVVVVTDSSGADVTSTIYVSDAISNGEDDDGTAHTNSKVTVTLDDFVDGEVYKVSITATVSAGAKVLEVDIFMPCKEF